MSDVKVETVAIFQKVGGHDYIALREVRIDGDDRRYGPQGPVVAVTTSREATMAAMRLLCGKWNIRGLGDSDASDD